MLSDDELRDIVGDEWLEWYRLTPMERWRESMKLWEHYVAIGSSLDPEPDSSSPFYFGEAPDPAPMNANAALRLVKRHGV